MDQEIDRKYKDRIGDLILEAAKSDDSDKSMAELSSEFCIALAAIGMAVTNDVERRRGFLNTCAKTMFEAEQQFAGRKTTATFAA